MQITLDLPQALVNKIRAYTILSGVGQIEPVITELIDSTVSAKIAEAVGHGEATPLSLRKPVSGIAPASAPVVIPEADTTGISDGLGDEDLFFDDDLAPQQDLTPEAETDPEALVPAPIPETGSDEDLFGGDPDLDEGFAAAAPVEDTFEASLVAEEAFASAGGGPSPAAPVHEASQISRRQARQTRGKARVSPLTESM